jgi:hypothetical protein
LNLGERHVRVSVLRDVRIGCGRKFLLVLGDDRLIERGFN